MGGICFTTGDVYRELSTRKERKYDSFTSSAYQDLKMCLIKNHVFLTFVKKPPHEEKLQEKFLQKS